MSYLRSYLRSAFGLGWALAFAVVVVSCNDRDVWRVPGKIGGTPDAGIETAANRCVPGQTFACMGACGVPLSGYQVCAADGLSYGPCVCPDARLLVPLPSAEREGGGRIIIPGLGTGPLLPTTPGGPSGPSVGEGVVGAECRNAQDCITGLDCFSATTDSLGFGGPAGGYCSTPCGSQAACTSIDPGSGCATIGGQQVCVRMCASKEAPEGQSKCLSREDVTCVSVAALGDEEPTDEPQLGICVPRCQSDAACPGRRCDLSSGLCSDAPRVGGPISSDCSVPEDCAGGVCLPLNENVTPFCTAFCTRGVSGCGFDGTEPSIGATCFFRQVPGEGPGDRGLCVAQCDVDADCPEPGSVCVPQEAAEGRAGICVHPVVPPGPPPGAAPGTTGNACSVAADCGGGLTCLTTASDPFGLGGGPAGGYCSAACTQDSDCPDPGSQCLGGAAGKTFCLRGCAVGEANQCQGRDTLTCNVAPNETVGFCQPQCNGDADCGERTCNVRTGLCVAAPPTPTPGCTADAQCGAGRICSLGVCVAAPPRPDCVEDADCDGQQLCDTEEGVCVDAPDCVEDADCDGQQLCDTAEGTCVAAPVPCIEDTECGAQVCDTALGECVEPALDCDSDADCGAQVCDLGRGECVDVACTLDADCDDAEVCDTARAACIAAPAISIGDACAQNADCAGDLCAELDGSSFCSAVCTIDTAVGCEPYGSDAFCLLPAQGSNRGACVELCNTASDCAQAGYICEPIGGNINGRTGGCLPPLPPLPVGDVCTLDADCADGEVCNLASAACIAAPAIPIGGACVADDECSENFCVSLGPINACSGLCQVGTPLGCESYGSDALCFPDANGSATGFCVEMCDIASDCTQSGNQCAPLGVTINDRTGFCRPVRPAVPAPAP